MWSLSEIVTRLENQLHVALHLGGLKGLSATVVCLHMEQMLQMVFLGTLHDRLLTEKCTVNDQKRSEHAGTNIPSKTYMIQKIPSYLGGHLRLVQLSSQLCRKLDRVRENPKG